MDPEADADRVIIYTADGTAHKFDECVRGGYHYAENGYIDDGWYGHIERVEATRGSRTVIVENDMEMTLEVTCSLWRTPNEAPYDFRMRYENAHKMYDGPVGDEPVYGSPGRTIRSIKEMAHELEIDFDNRQDCDPDGDVAVTFDCTTVTVRPEEFVNGVEEIYRPTLTFADGTRQLLSEPDEMLEPPQTFAGTGEHEGKGIEHLNIWNDVTGSAMFTYTNPDIDSCDAGGSSSQGSKSVESSNASEPAEATEPSEPTATTPQTSTEPTPAPTAETSTASSTENGSTPSLTRTQTTFPTETSNRTPESNESLRRSGGGVIDGERSNERVAVDSDDLDWLLALAGISSFGGIAYLANRLGQS
ncbi:hypothetical protein ACT3HL_03130 [Halobellus sp. GM3]